MSTRIKEYLALGCKEQITYISMLAEAGYYHLNYIKLMTCAYTYHKFKICSTTRACLFTALMLQNAADYWHLSCLSKAIIYKSECSLTALSSVYNKAVTLRAAPGYAKVYFSQFCVLVAVFFIAFHECKPDRGIEK